MKGLPLVEEEGSKTGCFTDENSRNGEIKGYNHRGGSTIPQYSGERKTKTQFIQCHNERITQKWMIGAATRASFHIMPLNEYCGMVLPPL